MDGYAINIKHGLFYRTLRHGQYFPSYNYEDKDKVIKFQSPQEINKWLTDMFPLTRIVIKNKAND